MQDSELRGPYSRPGSATDYLGDLAQVALLKGTSKMLSAYCSHEYKVLYIHIITATELNKRLYL